VASFRVRHTLANGMPGVLGGTLLAGYLTALLQLDPPSLRAFAFAALAALCVLTPLGHLMERRAQRDVLKALAAEAAAALDDSTLRAGYRAALRLPLEGLVWQMLCWPTASLVVIGSLWLQLGELDPFRSLAVACSALSGGAIVLPFAYYALRALVRPVRERLALRLPLEERAQLSLVVPLRWKLVAPTAVVCAATFAFAALFAYSAALRPLEAHDTRVKSAFLHWALERLPAGEPALGELRGLARELHAAEQLLRLDPSGRELGEGRRGSRIASVPS
jgi:hypothetical protein